LQSTETPPPNTIFPRRNLTLVWFVCAGSEAVKGYLVKHIVLATATVALLAGPALAQTSKTVTTTTKTTTISPAEETQMREFVVREHHPSIAPPPAS
jgi:hypothetical protein